MELELGGVVDDELGGGFEEVLCDAVDDDEGGGCVELEGRVVVAAVLVGAAEEGSDIVGLVGAAVDELGSDSDEAVDVGGDDLVAKPIRRL